jgi:hypothetical protein
MRWLVVAGSMVMVSAGLLAAQRGAAPAAAPEAAMAESARHREPPAALQAVLSHLTEEVRTGADGALVISNQHYRADFSRTAGVAITPRLDRALTPSQTWRYRVRRLETATAHRVLEPVAPAISRSGAHVVDFERPGLIERYEGERTGVEQIFVLTERPAGEGDVRIVGEIAFSGRAAENNGGLEFTAIGERAPFTYSKPIAFDADRRPLPVHVELERSHLSLVLDEAALASARFPVTVDPLYGLAQVDPSNLGPPTADIAYNPDLGEFLVVYAGYPPDQPFGEIRARRYLEQGDPIGGPIVVSSDNLVLDAHVAYDYHTNIYLVVWAQTIETEFGVADIACGRRLSSHGVPVGGTMYFAQSNNITPYSLDVVARNQREHNVNDPAFMVVWSDFMPGAKVVKAELVAANGTQLGELAVAPDASTRQPSVSYDAANDQFFVTWRNDATQTIRGRTLALGMGISPILTIGVDGSAPQSACDAATRRCLVTWRWPGTAAITGLRGRLYDALPTPIAIGGEIQFKPPATSKFTPFAVAAEPGEFLIAYGTNTNASKWLSHLAVSSEGHVWNDMQIDFNRTGEIRAGIAVGQHGFIAGAHGRFDPNTGKWYLGVSNTGRRFARYVHGSSGDYDGDGRSDLFLYELGTATWWVKTQTAMFGIGFDATSAVPVLLDWDADGRADLATFNTSNGQWRIRLTATSTVQTLSLGLGGDIPVPGDYYGDARDEIAVFRPSTGEWRILAHDDVTPTVVAFGQVGDQPTPADWDADGKIELGVFRASTKTWLSRELGGAALPTAIWGGPGIPLQGNFVGSSRADQAFFQQHLGVWKIRDGRTGAITTVDPGVGVWGVTMPLDWDGDGRLNIAWYDSESGIWTILDDRHPEQIVFGHLGDIPAGGR